MRPTCVIFAALTLLAAAGFAVEIDEKSQAPAFSARALDGKSIDLAALKGKVVLLDFGAVNCPPCKIEMPVIEAWHKRYRRNGLAVVGLMEMNLCVRI